MSPDSEASARRKLIRLQPQRSPRRAHQLLRAGIRDGLIESGASLDEQDLVRQLSTSRNSVREALALLVSEQVVTRRQHHGTKAVGRIRRVSLDSPNLEGITRTGRDAVTWHEIERQVISAPPIVAAKLSLEEGGRVLVTEHLLTLEDAPYSLRVGYRPLRDGQAAPRQSAHPQEEFAAIFQSVARVAATIEAVPTEERTARLLGTAPGSPLLLHEILLFDDDDLPVDLAFVSYHAGRVALSSEAAALPWAVSEAGEA
jgi:GntR family transcriptional regulator